MLKQRFQIAQIEMIFRLCFQVSHYWVNKINMLFTILIVARDESKITEFI